jgi:hypothetical protein
MFCAASYLQQVLVLLKHLLLVGDSTCRKHLEGRRFGTSEVEMVVREWF